MHALINETALFFRSKNVTKLTIFLELVTIMHGPRIFKLFRGDLLYSDLKNRAVSYISACITMRGNTVLGAQNISENCVIPCQPLTDGLNKKVSFVQGWQCWCGWCFALPNIENGLKRDGRLIKLCDGMDVLA